MNEYVNVWRVSENERGEWVTMLRSHIPPALRHHHVSRPVPRSLDPCTLILRKIYTVVLYSPGAKQYRSRRAMLVDKSHDALLFENSNGWKLDPRWNFVMHLQIRQPASQIVESYGNRCYRVSVTPDAGCDCGECFGNPQPDLSRCRKYWN